MCSLHIVPIDVWMIEGLFTHICMKAWRPFIPICVCLGAAIYGSPHLCLLWGPPCMAVPRFSNVCLTLCFPQWQCPHKHCPYCPDYIGAMCNLYVRFEGKYLFCWLYFRKQVPKRLHHWGKVPVWLTVLAKTGLFNFLSPFFRFPLYKKLKWALISTFCHWFSDFRDTKCETESCTVFEN